jgi:hypothetical protein
MPQPRVDPDAPAVVEQLERLLANSDFDASLRGRALLRFIVSETLRNPQESLSLSTIAKRVFRRGDDFDSRVDPAVRIEVARLRRALARYYRRTGAEDPVCISLARGACVPVARWSGGARDHEGIGEVAAFAPVSRQ